MEQRVEPRHAGGAFSMDGEGIVMRTTLHFLVDLCLNELVIRLESRGVSHAGLSFSGGE